MGNVDVSTCSHWNAEEGAAALKSGEGTISLPWSGDPLGLSDVGFIAGARRPLVVGVAGPHNAGKTTLLAAWYLLLARGIAELGEYSFSGSYSLSGWEAIAGNLRWEPQVPPSFPEHTVSAAGRSPGLLHLEMTSKVGGRKSFLFADAPGEWFNKWAIHRDDPAAAGAQWIAENADILLLVADREALGGATRGQARSGLQFLAKRLGAEIGKRPVALVWTKADSPISVDMEESVRRIAQSSLPCMKEFFVSIKATEADAMKALSEVLLWILSKDSLTLQPPEEVVSSNDPLFLVGRRSVA